MDLYEKNGNILYILKVLQKYSDEDHKMSKWEIKDKINEIYHVDIDERTIRRNIDLLRDKEELGYDIESEGTNRTKYWLERDSDTEFDPGEVRAIIDTFNYAGYIVPHMATNIIKKCKNLQNVYENKKLKDYEVYYKDIKTQNPEVIKNIEDITDAISEKKKITLEYWKYSFSEDIHTLTRKVVSKPKVSPYALIYEHQEFYMIAYKDGGEDMFYRYRLDNIKNIKITEEPVLKKTKKEVEDFVKNSVFNFGGHDDEIEAIVDMNLLNGTIDELGKDIKYEKINDEKFRINLVADTLGFKLWAMRNIDRVVVTKPESLKKEMQDIIWKAGERYAT